MTNDVPAEPRLDAVADHAAAMHMVNTILDMIWGGTNADQFVVARACAVVIGITLRENFPVRDRPGWLRVFRDEIERVMSPVGNNADGTPAKIH